MKEIIKSPGGHRILKNENNFAVYFRETMKCFSTSPLNGGISELDYCFNHKLSKWIETANDLPNKSIRDYLANIGAVLGCDPEVSTGLMTTALIENASIESEKAGELSLFTIITAGAGTNAVRSGDPPCYHEHSPNTFVPVCGTINIILVIEANLPVETLARAAIIATEAKTAAMQDLSIKSCFSEKIATGTGTDGLIIACHKNHPLTFTDVGNHSNLGHLISTIIKRGVAKSLIKEKISYENSKGEKENNVQ